MLTSPTVFLSYVNLLQIPLLIMFGMFPVTIQCVCVLILKDRWDLGNKSPSFPNPEGNKAFWIRCKLSAAQMAALQL